MIIYKSYDRSSLDNFFESLKRQGDWHVVLEEEDFYPPPDERQWYSMVEDIEGGDNFFDYLSEFYEMYEEYFE